MKATFKTKLLLHINQKKQQTGEQGFTLIELLVVIIIIGILAAIALPSFLNQANKAKQSEGKTYSTSVNKAEQAWFTEKGEFLVTGDTKQIFDSLGVGIQTQTTNFTYKVSGDKDSKASVLATPINKKALRSYSGTVGLVGNPDKTAQAIVCQSKTVDKDPTAANVGTDKVECAGDMEPL